MIVRDDLGADGRVLGLWTDLARPFFDNVEKAPDSSTERSTQLCLSCRPFRNAEWHALRHVVVKRRCQQLNTENFDAWCYPHPILGTLRIRPYVANARSEFLWF